MPIIKANLWKPGEASHYVASKTENFNKLPFAVHSVNFAVFSPEVCLHRILDQYMIIYTFSGRGLLETSGKKYILSDNAVCILKKSAEVKYYNRESDPWELGWIFLEGVCCDAFYDIAFPKEIKLIKTLDPGYVKNVFNDLSRKIMIGKLCGELACCNIVSQLWSKILCDLQADKVQDPQIQKIIEFMRLNYKRRLTVSEITEVFSVSTAQLCRKFKKITGMTPYEYTLFLRIDQAKRLLLNTGLTILDIAVETGFDSSSHFSQCFKKFEKITPTEYRNNIF